MRVCPVMRRKRVRSTYDLGDDGDVGAERVEVDGVGGNSVVSDFAFCQDALEQGEGERALRSHG